MKKAIMFLVFTLMKNFAFAEVVAVNDNDKKVYFQPTPTLEVSLMDLGKDGGFLSLFLEYDTVESRTEFAELKTRYPGYEVQYTSGESTDGNVFVSIADGAYSENFKLRQGQLGPYLNAQVVISTEQTKKVKKALSERIIQKNFKIKSQVIASETLESVFFDSTFCEKVRGQNLKESFLKIMRLEKPSTIKFEKTFFNLKENLLSHCFEIQESRVVNFADLLNLKIGTENPPERIQAHSFETKETSIITNINPLIKIQIN